MRLLIVGTLDGHIATAGKIALERGAKVAHVDTVDAALSALRSGQGADLIMIDVCLDTNNIAPFPNPLTSLFLLDTCRALVAELNPTFVRFPGGL